MIGLLAAGAVLVSGVPAFALTGPGGDGASTTAKEADVLLNKADKLTKNDSPKRFGDGLQNAGSTAKQYVFCFTRLTLYCLLLCVDLFREGY